MGNIERSPSAHVQYSPDRHVITVLQPGYEQFRMEADRVTATAAASLALLPLGGK